jgi:transcriptional regulator GlxA family with amidase domain
VDGSIAYRDVRVAATQMRQEWRPETQAVKTTRERRASEKACLARLKELMRANPTAPVPKARVRPDFANVSARTFDRLYSQAVRDSGASAWGAPGRRPRI